MELTIVGCAPAWTRRPGRASSCYLLEDGGQVVALDIGQGAFAEMARYVDPSSLAGVLVSHLHGDHLVDLVPLRHYLMYEAETAGRTRLHGPAELRGRLNGLLDEPDFLAALPGDGLEPGRFELAGMAVEARHVTHIPDSYAFRLAADDGAGLIYSGDCAEPADLLPLLRAGDTLLSEAAFGSGPSEAGGHMTARQAAQAANEGGAARLVLTHILDRRDEQAARRAAAEVFGGEVLIAQPGLKLTIG
ncbi:MAG TPA: MBL fold metallo-hydrolase [Candidatus Limnocylindria bacterium]|jgi:ribonuclease BN (tRNA processing enzyme)|nr:MBL fold metallo-hydrolase [Candidatus Limnocylindria bacterium]